MKKLLILIFIALPISAFSQLFEGGIEVGFCGSQIDGDGRGGYSKLSPSLLVYSQLNFHQKLSLSAGVGFLEKGARNMVNENYNVSLYYAEIPVLLNWRPFTKDFIFPKLEKFNFTWGLVLGYLIKGTYNDNGFIQTEKELGLHKFDFYLYSSLNYKFSNRLSIHFVHNYSLIPVRNDNLNDCYTTNFFYGIINGFNISANGCWWNNTIRCSIQYRLYTNEKIEK